jgi:hypothetical protein
MKTKKICQLIGMIHLKRINQPYNNAETLEQVYQFALKDLKALEEGGADAAIVENFFDLPYSLEIDLETLVAFISIFTRLREEATIPLGINLQQTNNNEEIIIGNLLKADFIRSEAYVEYRVTSSGMLTPQNDKIEQYRFNSKSNVKVFADINVKHSYPLIDVPIVDNILNAIDLGADSIVLTGGKTGSSPQPSDILELSRQLPEDVSILIGSGIKVNNISAFKDVINGVIVGSSIKENNDLSCHVDVEKVKQLKAALA